MTPAERATLTAQDGPNPLPRLRRRGDDDTLHMGDALAGMLDSDNEWIRRAGGQVAFYRQPCPRGCVAGHIKGKLCDCPKGRRAAIHDAWEYEWSRASMQRRAENRLAAKMRQFPPVYQAFTLDGSPLNNTPQMRAIRLWLAAWNGTQNLILMGEPGIGKTGLVVGLLRQLMGWMIERSYTFTFATSAAWSQELYDAMAMHEPLTELTQRYAQVDVLALDDIGAEGDLSDFALKHLFTLLDTRYQYQRGTIMTTNLGPDELRSHLGPRLMSRLIGERGGESPRGTGVSFFTTPASKQPPA